MTEDYIVSCWPVPVRGKKNASGHLALMHTYADAVKGMVYQEGDKLLILVGDFELAPGDTLCRTASGQWGVKRGDKVA